MYDFVIMRHTFLALATARSCCSRCSPPRTLKRRRRAKSVRFAPTPSAARARRYVADLADGGRAELTLDPRLQESDRGACCAPSRYRYGGRGGASRCPTVECWRWSGGLRPTRAGRRGAGAAPLGARGVGVQGRVGAAALVEAGVAALPAPATTAACRRSLPETCRPAGARSPLRHAGVTAWASPRTRSSPSWRHAT